MKTAETVLVFFAADFEKSRDPMLLLWYHLNMSLMRVRLKSVFVFLFEKYIYSLCQRIEPICPFYLASCFNFWLEVDLTLSS